MASVEVQLVPLPLLVLLMVSCSSVAASSFDWPKMDTLSSFTLQGDAVLYMPGEVKLTIGVADAPFSASAGRMVYGNPLRLCKPISKKGKSVTQSASFNSSITFQSSSGFTSPQPAYEGDGIALFFLAAENLTAAAASLTPTKGLFALFADPQVSALVVAVELDSSKEAWDPDDNHVGLDIHSVRSVDVRSLNGTGLRLVSGVMLTASVQYSAAVNRLDVFIGPTNSADAPLLVLSVPSFRLCDHLPSAHAFVGLSSASRGSVETHDLYGWTWQSSF